MEELTYLCIDTDDGKEYITSGLEEIFNYMGSWCACATDETRVWIELPKGSIKKLIGKNLKPDEFFELKL